MCTELGSAVTYFMSRCQLPHVRRRIELKLLDGFCSHCGIAIYLCVYAYFEEHSQNPHCIVMLQQHDCNDGIKQWHCHGHAAASNQGTHGGEGSVNQ